MASLGGGGGMGGGVAAGGSGAAGAGTPSITGVVAPTAGVAPIAYEDVAARAVFVPIVYGSISFWLGKKQPANGDPTHKWSVFVRHPEGKDLSYIIAKVVFTLHPTFPSHKRGELPATRWCHLHAITTAPSHPCHVSHHVLHRGGRAAVRGEGIRLGRV